MNYKDIDRVWLVFAPIFVSLLGLDQISKWWALSNLEFGKNVDFGLKLVYNDGIVFGIDLPIWGIYALTLGILGFGIFLVWKEELWRDIWHLSAFAFILAGAIGNVIDRIRFGYVIDFLQVYWWPTFNLADVWIVCAVIFFLWDTLVRQELLSD